MNIVLNRSLAEAAFRSYTENYDVSDIKIKLKIDHTYRVAEIADRIAVSIGADRDFAWFLGLLHDIGRFEQVTRYGTFRDADSVDHAELGADILFRNGLIETFITPRRTTLSGENGMGNTDEGSVGDILTSVAKCTKSTFCNSAQYKKALNVAETAIRLHNKLAVPEDLDPDTMMYAKLLRDADKVDIFRVLTEPPYDERNAGIRRETARASERVMTCVRQHRCVPRGCKQTDFENLISQCCMAFELEFKISREIAEEQGYLKTLLNIEVTDAGMKEQSEILRTELYKAWSVASSAD